MQVDVYVCELSKILLKAKAVLGRCAEWRVKLSCANHVRENLINVTLAGGLVFCRSLL